MSSPSHQIAHVSLRASALVPRVPRSRRVAAVLTMVFVLFGLASLLAPWQQNVRGAGRVISYAPIERRQSVQAPVAGRVEKFFVREGSQVKAGDPLLELRDNDPRLLERLEEQRTASTSKLASYSERVEQQQAQIESLRRARDAAVAAAKAKLAVAEQKLSAESRKQEAAEAALETARLQARRVRLLADKGLSSERDMELARLSQTKEQTELESLRASVSGARADVQAARAELDQKRADGESKVQEALSKLESARSDVADTRASLSKIEVEVARQHSQRVVAPRAGVVLSLLAAEGGALVKPGEPLLELVPDSSDRAIEVWVDGNDAPLIEPGRHVRVQFEGWPAVQFAGWPSVAVGTFGGRVAFVDAHSDGRGSFRVVVTPDADDALWPATRYLRQGARAKAWILLEQVRLGYELWRQFNGFPPSVAPPEDAAAKASGDGK